MQTMTTKQHTLKARSSSILVSKRLQVRASEVVRLIAMVAVVVRHNPIHDDILHAILVVFGKVQPFHDIVYVQPLVEKGADESVEILREVVCHWFAHSTKKVSGMQAHVLPFSSIQ